MNCKTTKIMINTGTTFSFTNSNVTRVKKRFKRQPLFGLRNIKRAPCLHNLMQTREGVWENSNVCVKYFPTPPNTPNVKGGGGGGIWHGLPHSLPLSRVKHGSNSVEEKITNFQISDPYISGSYYWTRSLLQSSRCGCGSYL